MPVIRNSYASSVLRRTEPGPACHDQMDNNHHHTEMQRVRSLSHPPRPSNKFMIFRSHYIKTMRKKSGSGSIEQNHLSKQAGIVWRSMTMAEQRPFEEKAEQEKRLHAIRYPNYKFNPGNRGKKRRAASIARSSVTRSSVESDSYVPPRPSRHASRPSLLAVEQLSTIAATVKQEPTDGPSSPVLHPVELAKTDNKSLPGPSLSRSQTPDAHLFQGPVLPSRRLDQVPDPSSSSSLDQPLVFSKAEVDPEAHLTLASRAFAEFASTPFTDFAASPSSFSSLPSPSSSSLPNSSSSSSSSSPTKRNKKRSKRKEPESQLGRLHDDWELDSVAPFMDYEMDLCYDMNLSSCGFGVPLPPRDLNETIPETWR